MKGGDRAVYLQGLVNLVAEFAHGLVGKRDDEYLFRCDVLAFHKVFHFGGYSGGLSCTCAGHDQHVVFVCENHLPLLFVQGDCWIDFGEYGVQIMLLRDKVALQVGLIVLLDAGGAILQVGKVGVIAKERLNGVGVYPISLAVVAGCLSRLHIGEEGVHHGIIVNQLAIVAPG